MLLDLLAVKFGPVPAGVRRHIEEAGKDELTLWGRRVLTAATLDEVLSLPSPARRPPPRAARPRRQPSS